MARADSAHEYVSLLALYCMISQSAVNTVYRNILTDDTSSSDAATAR